MRKQVQREVAECDFCSETFDDVQDVSKCYYCEKEACEVCLRREAAAMTEYRDHWALDPPAAAVVLVCGECEEAFEDDELLMSLVMLKEKKAEWKTSNKEYLDEMKGLVEKVKSDLATRSNQCE